MLNLNWNEKEINLMVSTEASWWNILNWRYTQLLVIYFHRQPADDAKAKHVSQVQEDKWNNITKSCVYLQEKEINWKRKFKNVTRIKLKK